VDEMDPLRSLRNMAENFRVAANNSVKTVFATAPELPALPELPELPELPALPGGVKLPDISELVGKLPKLPGMQAKGMQALPEIGGRVLGGQIPFKGIRGISPLMAIDVERPLLQRAGNMAMMV